MITKIITLAECKEKDLHNKTNAYLNTFNGKRKIESITYDWWVISGTDTWDRKHSCCHPKTEVEVEN